MGTDNFTLIISQSTTDPNDFAVHLKEQKCKKEKLLAHIRFSKTFCSDEPYMDEIVSLVAQKLAQKIIDKHQKVENTSKKLKYKNKQFQASSKEIVDALLAKLQKETK